MEIEGTLFIGAAIIALTQLAKYVVPNASGAITIGIAVLVGIVVALVDQFIGVTDITVAQGIMVALAAVGTTTVASKVGVNTTPTVK